MSWWGIGQPLKIRSSHVIYCHSSLLVLPADTLVKLFTKTYRRRFRMEYHGIGFLTHPVMGGGGGSRGGGHINQAGWRELKEEMKKRGYKGLLPFIAGTLHIVHNTFHKGIVSLDQEVEQLAFDLHAWFKQSHKPGRCISLQHVSTRWLTLSPALERIIDGIIIIIRLTC